SRSGVQIPPPAPAKQRAGACVGSAINIEIPITYNSRPIRRRPKLPAGGRLDRLPGHEYDGEVAERSNAADCKSVALAASEVRILPSPPTSPRRQVRRLSAIA